MVGMGTDKATDLMHDGGNVEEKAVLVRKLVKVLGFLEESFAKKGHLFAVITMCLVFLG